MEVIVGVWTPYVAPRGNSTGEEPSPANPQVSTDPSKIHLPSAPTHDPSSTPRPPNRPTTNLRPPTPSEVRNKVHRHIDELGTILSAHSRKSIAGRVSAGTFAVLPVVMAKFKAMPLSHWHNLRDSQANAFRSTMIKAMARGFDVRVGKLLQNEASFCVGNMFQVHKRYADGTALVEADVVVFDELTQLWQKYTHGVNTIAAMEAAMEIAAAEAKAAKAKVAEAAAEKEGEGE